MAGQTSSSFFTAPGIPGGVAVHSEAQRFVSRIINSAGATPNTFGFVYTESTTGDVQLDATAQAGGTGILAGILVQPKAAATFGTTAGGPLAATLNLPDFAAGTLMQMGSVFVALPAATAIGNLVSYNTTTGAIAATFAPTATFTGVIAANVLTVSALTAGSIGVGSVVTTTAGAVLGRVASLGTGTGGNGTYNLDSSSVATGSSAMVASSAAAAAGTKLIPNARVDYF